MAADDAPTPGSDEPSIHDRATLLSGESPPQPKSLPPKADRSSAATPGDSGAAVKAAELPKLALSFERFAECLSQCGLVSAHELASVCERLPGESAADVDTVAWQLVQSNKLTVYQLRRVAQGKSAGLVLGNYVVLDELGAGGMGVVYLARHRRMKRLVALKVLPANLVSSSSAITRFHREVEAVAKLSHPNIVSAYDADEAGDLHFLVMEYVDGIDLDAYVERCGVLPIPLALDFLAQAARGLAHAHERGIVHRDIKPANLLLDQTGTIKILDMGLARIEQGDPESDHQNLTQSGRVMGTVDFMAPEQALDAKRADHRADIYSLGCTLHYLLSGLTLSPEGSLAMKLLWHQNSAVPSLRVDVPQASKRLDALFLRMLAKKPEDRPQSVDAVLAELLACQAEVGPVTPAERVERLGQLRRTPETVVGGRFGQTPVPSAETLGPTRVGDPTPLGASQAAVASRPMPSPARKKPWVTLGAAAAILIAGGLGWGAYQLGIASGEAPEEEALAAVPAPIPQPTTSEVAMVPTPGPSVPTAPPPMPEAPERRALLRWVSEQRGRTTILAGDPASRVEIASVELMPTGSFSIVGIDLSGLPIGGDDLVRLDPDAVRNLETLSLAGTSLGDADLAQLPPLPTLVRLDLSATRVTDAGLPTLTRLTNLRELNLSRTAVSDAGMEPLRSLDRLTHLYLADTRVGDRLPEVLANTRGLSHLGLAGTSITAGGVHRLQAEHAGLEVEWDAPDPDREVARHVLAAGGVLTIQPRRPGAEPIDVTKTANLPADEFRITQIDLAGSRDVDDVLIARLALLPGLTLLRLESPRITPAALESLAAASHLTALDLGAVELPEEAVAALRARLPNCDIRWQAVDQRRLAQWALEQGGAVSLVTADGDRLDDLKQRHELPLGRFRLRAIDLSHRAQITDDDLRQVAGLTDVESLLLAGTGVTDAGLASIAAAKSLRELDLSQTAVSDRGVAALAALPALEQLFLTDTTIGDDAVRSLRRLEYLSHLGLAGTKVTQASLADLAHMPALRWLSLARVPLDDRVLAELSQGKSWTELSIEGTSLTDAGIEELRGALPECKVAADPLDPQRLAARWVVEQGGAVKLADDVLVDRLSALPRDACTVVSVDLKEADRLRGDVLAELAPCVALVEIDLSGTRTGDRELASIGNFPQLRALRLRGTRVTDAGLTHLAPLKQLETLDLGETPLDGRGLGVLAEHPKLWALSLRECRLADRHLAAIARIPALVYLDLGYNIDLTDAAIKELEQLEQLESLSLARTGVTDAGLTTVADLEQLRSLDLSSTAISDAGLAQLAPLKQLAKLRIGGTGITEASISTLAGWTGLRELDITRNKLEPEDLQRLHEALPNCRVTP
ncbi:MAG: protein kinase [Pirellulales bacterium]|nr:protein kinase [Pirellulales bacterium]